MEKFFSKEALMFNNPQEYFNHMVEKKIKEIEEPLKAQIAGLESQAAIREAKIKELEDELTKFDNVKNYKFKIDDPVSPQVTGINHRGQMISRGVGLTKREYFIGQALVGLVGKTSYNEVAREAIYYGTKVAELLANEHD